jgi:hypothetical protein
VGLDVTEATNQFLVRIRAIVVHLCVRPATPSDVRSPRSAAYSTGGLHCAHSTFHLAPAHRRLRLAHTIRFVLSPFLLRNGQQAK